MITGDNIVTAEATTIECGILEPHEDMNLAFVSKVEWSCCSSHWRWDKSCTGFKGSRCWTFNGIQGTEVTKESSDIVIMDDNFTSVVTVLRWATSSGEVPLTAVQLLWVNLIINTGGALALPTKQPTDDLMKMPPAGRSKPLISNIMWRNLIARALYQVAILLTLQLRGKSIFGVKNTLIFNTFVLCQAFNEFNAKEVEQKNIFQGLHKNKLFLGIVVEFLKTFANT
ncbi:hypothetical protein PTKIN_Ptkin11bG0102900 [Pterospermum kingtungense]